MALLSVVLFEGLESRWVSGLHLLEFDGLSLPASSWGTQPYANSMWCLPWCSLWNSLVHLGDGMDEEGLGNASRENHQVMVDVASPMRGVSQTRGIRMKQKCARRGGRLRQGEEG